MYSQVTDAQTSQSESFLSDPSTVRGQFALSLAQITEPVSVASLGMRVALKQQFDSIYMKLSNAFSKLAALATGDANFMPVPINNNPSGFAYAFPDTVDFRAAQMRRNFMKGMNKSQGEYAPLKIAASSQVLAAPNWAASTQAPTTLEVMEIEARKRDIERLRQWFHYYGQDGLIKQRAK
ncbi:MAG: hypothetical protein IAF58_03360 [Leptolyngbya sp.]|nr:hypothetical protein [Candidatus Melainabacteria bacterium]